MARSSVRVMVKVSSYINVFDGNCNESDESMKVDFVKKKEKNPVLTTFIAHSVHMPLTVKFFTRIQSDGEVYHAKDMPD